MKKTFVVVHCSDTTDNPHSINYDLDPAEIRKWHTAPKNLGGNGWEDIGYHYLIRRDGTLYIGRDEKKQGAHVKGHNKGSVAVCLIGKRVFTQKQLDTLFSLYLNIKSRLGIESKNWHGHYEFDDSKTCPNLDMDSLRVKLELL